MAAAAADTSDWDDGDDDAAGTATTEPLPGSRRRTRRRSLRIALPPHLEQELHQSLMSEEQAAGAAGTEVVGESDGGASSGATRQQSDTERIVELNSSLHDAVAVGTLSSSSFAFEDEEEEEIPLAELLPREIEEGKDELSGVGTLAFERSENSASCQSAAAIDMVDGNTKSNDAETPSTCPIVTGEARDLKPELVTDSGLGIQSPSSDTTVGSSLGGGDQLETALQIAMPSQVGLSKPSTGAPVLNRDNLDASDVGLEETELSLAISNHSESSSCSDGGLEGSRLSTGAEADVRSNVTLLSEAEDTAGQNEETVLSLRIRVQELETQLQDRTEWAQQKVMQAARRLSKDLAELKSLRQAKDEMLRLKKDQKALEDSTMKKLSEMESALKKASGQVDRANAAVRRLENENAELRAEMEAAKLNAAESIAICQDIAKREKKSLKRAQAWERQKSKLQEDLSEERRKLTRIQQQLAQAKECQQQAEVRWRQEEKAKEEAILRADNEKRLREQADVAAKRREESMRRKAEADKQRHRDDIQRLEQEITGLRISAESSHLATSRWGPAVITLPDAGGRFGLKEMNEVSEFQESSNRDVCRDRECVMCMCEEMSVVFLPCAHQVVCTKCNELHEKQGMRDCPSCRTPIQQRIRVYGVSS